MTYWAGLINRNNLMFCTTFLRKNIYLHFAEQGFLAYFTPLIVLAA